MFWTLFALDSMCNGEGSITGVQERATRWQAKGSAGLLPIDFDSMQVAEQLAAEFVIGKKLGANYKTRLQITGSPSKAEWWNDWKEAISMEPTVPTSAAAEQLKEQKKGKW